ncbi:hypothetical protein BTN49_0097 [Candidatus Enterovibrio escicola]|uniref:Uncharacterized protein n=1 Tax=Candidatus Enterovibrio escicola TaxID=1927127 RepID=A0A2A5T7T1_9GAMM|nr:hypothetical protein BTN49_0097 [Candidatus Enterovibrio escacola]
MANKQLNDNARFHIKQRLADGDYFSQIARILRDGVVY